jgi:hypothetical protein
LQERFGVSANRAVAKTISRLVVTVVIFLLCSLSSARAQVLIFIDRGSQAMSVSVDLKNAVSAFLIEENHALSGS